MKTRCRKDNILLKVLSLAATCLLITGCSEENLGVVRAQSIIEVTPEVKNMLFKFSEQQHRFELNGCLVHYNGVDISLGKDVDKIANTFKDSLYEDVIQNTSTTVHFNNNNTLFIYSESPANVINSISIYIENFDENNELYLINGSPVNKDMNFKNLIDHSNFDLADFTMSTHGYLLSLGQCKKSTEYFFRSEVPFKYSGGGHLMMKDGVNLENTKPIESISITFSE